MSHISLYVHHLPCLYMCLTHHYSAHHACSMCPCHVCRVSHGTNALNAPVMRYMCLLMPHVTRASVTVLHMLNPVYHAIHTCFLWHTHPAIGARCPITCAVHSVACYRCVHACTISPDGPALLAYSHAWLCCRLPHGDRPPPPGPDLGLGVLSHTPGPLSFCSCVPGPASLHSILMRPGFLSHRT